MQSGFCVLYFVFCLFKMICWLRLNIILTRVGNFFLPKQFNVECRGVVGAPNYPYVILGGYPTRGADAPPYLNATALVVTYLLNNADADNDKSIAWEREVLEVQVHRELLSFCDVLCLWLMCLV